MIEFLIANATIVGVGLAIFIFIIVRIVRSLLHIARPNEVLIVSGRANRDRSGQARGYRLARNSYVIKMPIIEAVDRMDLRTFPVRLDIRGAYSKGGISLSVNAIANVKVSSEEPIIHNAIERFMGRDREEIVRVAQETLEGNLRGVLATMTPEQVNENRMLFSEQLLIDVNPDMDKLGLHLDTLKIQNVSDDRDYLDSLGRRRIAEIIKVAEVAESDALKEAVEAESKAQERVEVARRQAQAEIQRAQNELRGYEAELEQHAKSEEERAEAKALEAKASAERELQEVRTELEKLRLQADVVIPAQANKVAAGLIAEGEAAAIAENGRAMAQVLQMMGQVWSEAGDAAMDIFVLQKLEQIMTKAAEAANKIEVAEVSLIDGGDGQTLPNYVGSFPKVVGTIFEELHHVAGLNIGGILVGDTSRGQSTTEGAGALNRSTRSSYVGEPPALESNTTSSSGRAPLYGKSSSQVQQYSESRKPSSDTDSK